MEKNKSKEDVIREVSDRHEHRMGFVHDEGADGDLLFAIMNEWAKELHFQFKVWCNKVVTQPDKEDYKTFTDEEIWNIFISQTQ